MERRKRCIDCEEQKIIPEGLVDGKPIVIFCRELGKNVAAYSFCQIEVGE